MEDKFSFYDIDNYHIEFHRKPRNFSYSKFSQYELDIIFKDRSTNLPILQINTNEKRMYSLVIDLYQYNMYSSEQISMERVWFDQNQNGEVFILEVAAIQSDHPTELEVSRLTVYQLNKYSNTIIPRIIIDMDEFQLEDFIYNGWLMLEGLSYLQDIGRSELDDYLDFIGSNIDAINLD